MTRDELREEIQQLHERLARMEELQKRQDHEAWLQFQRERADAIQQAEKMSRFLRTQ